MTQLAALLAALGALLLPVAIVVAASRVGGCATVAGAPATDELHQRIDGLRSQVATLTDERNAALAEAQRWRNGGDLRERLIRNELERVHDETIPANKVAAKLLRSELALLQLRSIDGDNNG
jgi:outer membrane murein-binding lipoprotein Lpp